MATITIDLVEDVAWNAEVARDLATECARRL